MNTENSSREIINRKWYTASIPSRASSGGYLRKHFATKEHAFAVVQRELDDYIRYLKNRYGLENVAVTNDCGVNSDTEGHFNRKVTAEAHDCGEGRILTKAHSKAYFSVTPHALRVEIEETETNTGWEIAPPFVPSPDVNAYVRIQSNEKA